MAGPMREFRLEAFFSHWQPFLRHQLTASESETMSLVELLDLAEPGLREKWGRARLGYTDPRGAASLRQAIAGLYQSVSADHLLSFAGAQEAIFVAMHALLTPADHAIIVTPNYQSAETVPASICAISAVALDPARNWSLDIDRIESLLRPNSKLISINFPNNPTGKILAQDDFAALIALCRRHGLWLFNDEVYRLIERDPCLRLPPVVDLYERGISLCGLSKAFGLPGLRTGWLACRDPGAIQSLRRVKNYLSICAATPNEILAEIAIKASEPILSRNRQIAADNLALVDEFFAARRDLFEWTPPDGGVIGFPRYRGDEGAEAFCENLITEHGILLMPSAIFDSSLIAPPANHFRIGFGRRDFVAGLLALSEVLDRDLPVRKCAALT